MNVRKFLLAGLASALFCNLASASVIESATVVADTGLSGYSAVRLVNQSGLSASYVGGVTNFESYAASHPTHVGSSNNNGFLAANGVHVDLDFGSTFNFVKFGLFNDNDYQGVRNFSILVSDDASFTTFTSAGSFTASYGPTDYSPVSLQVFDLNSATGRYARINFINNFGGVDRNPTNPYVNVGEVIFASEASSVPEPTTFALLGLGLLSFAASRRKSAK